MDVLSWRPMLPQQSLGKESHHQTELKWSPGHGCGWEAQVRLVTLMVHKALEISPQAMLRLTLFHPQLEKAFIKTWPLRAYLAEVGVSVSLERG